MIIDKTSRSIAEVQKLKHEKEKKKDWITCNHLDKRIVFRQHACTTNLQVITKQTTKTAAVVSQENWHLRDSPEEKVNDGYYN